MSPIGACFVQYTTDSFHKPLYNLLSLSFSLSIFLSATFLFGISADDTGSAVALRLAQNMDGYTRRLNEAKNIRNACDIDTYTANLHCNINIHISPTYTAYLTGPKQIKK